MLDDILSSSVFTLIAVGFAAAAVVHVPGQSREPVQVAAAPVVVQLPKVVVTGHRLPPAQTVDWTAMANY